MSRRPNILDEKVVKENNTHRNEPEPNPEEEGQPTPPDEIDGVEEGEDATEDDADAQLKS